MRRPFIAGNFKMFKTVQETVAYRGRVACSGEGRRRRADIVIAPPFLSVHAAAEAARGSNIAVGAQNVHGEREGAFTGEVSAVMLREAGARYVIIGHSERRTLFGETDAGVNKKMHAVLTAGLTPIVCIGETLDQRDRNETLAVLDRQIKDGLDGVTGAQLAEMVVAYEPVWAIGTGRNATPQQAGEAHFHIRQRLKQWFGARRIGSVPRVVWWKREARKHRQAHRRARRRRRPRRRRLPRSQELHRDHPRVSG